MAGTDPTMWPENRAGFASERQLEDYSHRIVMRALHDAGMPNWWISQMGDDAYQDAMLVAWKSFDPSLASWGTFLYMIAYRGALRAGREIAQLRMDHGTRSCVRASASDPLAELLCREMVTAAEALINNAVLFRLFADGCSAREIAEKLLDSGEPSMGKSSVNRVLLGVRNEMQRQGFIEAV
jgi:DNA-directed RNA polymerase specialized sigma24 family protein